MMNITIDESKIIVICCEFEGNYNTVPEVIRRFVWDAGESLWVSNEQLKHRKNNITIGLDRRGIQTLMNEAESVIFKHDYLLRSDVVILKYHSYHEGRSHEKIDKLLGFYT